jgi:iron complex outermembrane receptor protein
MARLRSAAASTALLITVSAHAQAAPATTQPATQPTSPEAGAALPTTPVSSGDIVVTARRRAESVMSVPLSVQAFSEDTLRQNNITRLSDLAQISPGLNVQASPFGNGALTIAIRGQRQGLANIAYDPAVSVYVDEVLQARSQGLNDAFFDLDSVQVLKGPQGTLFGRNTTGGAVLVTSKAPTDKFEGYADLTLGDYALKRGEAAVNLPASDSLEFRFAGVVTRRDGYSYNPQSNRDVDDQRTESWRASMRFHPGDILDNRLVLSGFHENDSGVAYKAIAIVPGSLASLDAADFANYASEGFHTIDSIVPKDGTRIRTFNISNITSLDLGGVTLKNIFAYRRVASSIFFDLSGASPLLVSSQQDTHEHQISDEVQVLGKAFADQVDYVAGFYYFREAGHEIQGLAILDPNSPDNTITDYNIVSKTIAGYAQATYRPSWLANVSFTGGVRYTRDTRDFVSRSHYQSGVCRLVDADVGGTPLSPCYEEAKKGFSKPTYTLSVDWKFAPDNLLYFTHRYGYQSGGFTNSATLPSEFTPYQPETVQDYELGLKDRWRLGTVGGRSTIALFRGVYKNIQRLLTFTTDNPSGLPFPQNRIENAASATVQGIEVEELLHPVAGVDLTLSYTYLDAHYDRYFVSGLDYTGADFAGAPKNAFAGSLRLHLPVPERIGDTHFQIDGSYQSKTVVADTSSFDPATQANYPSSVLPGYGTYNVRLDFDQAAGLPLRVSAFIRNLGNARYYTAGVDNVTSIGNVVRLLGAPRTFGVELNYHF